jgi:hypothetical protein
MAHLYKSSNGQWLTQAIFWDMWINMPIDKRACDPVFTFDSDRPNLVNFKRTFVELGDVTGYEWAMAHLGSWDHWVYLMKRPWFLEIYESAKDELNVKTKAAAIKRIALISVTSENEGQALAASKYLAEQGWEKSRAGRPTKEKVTGELKRAIEEAGIHGDDLKRMQGLSVINGGKTG